MKINDKSICLRLGDERRRLNLNQSKVADYCDVSTKTVSRWERNTPIPADKLARLVLLGYDITYVLTSVKLAPRLEGLDAASMIWGNTSESAPKLARRQSDLVSDEQSIWSGILENLAGGDPERLKQIGLALVGYSQAQS